MGNIVIAAALILRDNGDTLLVRKRGTTAFLQPGGKIEPGETAEQALARELHEELGLTVATSRLQRLGRFEADAANEPGFRVIAHVFRLDLGADEPIKAAGEIEAAAWISPDQAIDIPMAPLTEHSLLPLHRRIISAGKA
jgi:mutator protein MutT